MSPAEMILALETARTRRDAARLLGETDLGEALFLRIAALSGENPSACIRLARRADWIPHANLAYLYRAKAVGARAAGKWALAGELFLRAGEAAQGPDRWTFSLGAIDSFARAGETQRAIAYGRQAIKGLQSEPLMAARARLNVANALVWQDRNEEARREYRLAAGVFAEGTAERAIAHLGLSTTSLFAGNPSEARDAAMIAQSEFESLGSTYHASLAGLNLAQADLQIGRPDDAVRQLLELASQLDDSPPDTARIQEFLGDSYLRLNLAEEAQSAYSSALKSSAIEEMPLNQANCRFGLARLVEDTHATESSRLYRLAARGYARVGNRPWELASSARAFPDSLVTAVAELRRLRARFLAEELELWGAERGYCPLGKKPTSPVLEWRHALIVARRNPSKKNYRRVFELIERDRQAIRTPSAALRFFDDRGAAVNEYLVLLIESGDVATALDAISRARSAALVDEILASQGEKLSEEAIGQLEAIRIQAEADQAPGSRLRGSSSAGTPRAWTEATWTASSAIRNQAASTPADSDVWLDTGVDLYRMRSEVADKLDIDSTDLGKKLDWFEFFLFEPMLDPKADWNCPEPLVSELRSLAGIPQEMVCPDGVLWRMPWTLLSSNEVRLTLNPSFKSEGRPLKSRPRVAIWAAHADDLPAIDAEIDAVQSSFPDAMVLKSRAQIRESYGQHFDLIHIAGHARLNPRSPALSNIEFADGPLYATEIARSGLRTELAVVAACRSGIAAPHQRFEPEGIVRALLACGASSAVGSLWPLDDRFTARFMSHLYSEMAYGKTLMEAMSVARRKGREEFPHPYYWGSLATFGGYRNPS